MWGSVETTVKLAFTGLAGFTLACVVIETAGTAIGSTVAGSSESGYFVTRTLVELLLALYVADFVTGLIHMLLDFQTVDDCVEINQCVGCTRQFFTKSFLSDGAAVLARSSGEEPASPRHRAGVASMAWRTRRRFNTNAP